MPTENCDGRNMLRLFIFLTATLGDEETKQIIQGEAVQNLLFHPVSMMGSRSNQMSSSSTPSSALEKFGLNVGALFYGCHCQAIVEEKGYGLGKAVDPLDSVCKDYLGCMRCVKKQTSCPRSAYGYFVDESVVHCLDDAGSCERSHCECDAKFFGDIWDLAVKGLSYDFQYVPPGFDVHSNCKRQEMSRKFESLKTEQNAQCCGGNSHPMELFNTHKYSCCPDVDGRSLLRRRC